jgi:hypothetical protein
MERTFPVLSSTVFHLPKMASFCENEVVEMRAKASAAKKCLHRLVDFELNFSDTPKGILRELPKFNSKR